MNDSDDSEFWDVIGKTCPLSFFSPGRMFQKTGRRCILKTWKRWWRIYPGEISWWVNELNDKMLCTSVHGFCYIQLESLPPSHIHRSPPVVSLASHTDGLRGTERPTDRPSVKDGRSHLEHSSIKMVKSVAKDSSMKNGKKCPPPPVFFFFSFFSTFVFVISL